MDNVKAKAIRCYLGESIEKFSKRIGVSISTISAIERKERDISDYVRSKLIRIESGLPSDFFIFYDYFRKSA